MPKIRCFSQIFFILVVLSTTLFSSTPASFAGDNADQVATPTTQTTENSPDSEAKSEHVQNAQPSIDKKVQGDIDKPQNRLVQEAISALEDTKKALKALEDGKKEEALACLERIVGKLQLAVARNPKLALFPVSQQTIVHDLFAKAESVEAAIKEAKNKLNDGAVQAARHILASLASEIIVQVTKLPIATFPKAIMAVAPLIDADKIEEAKALLRQTLGTLVIEEYIMSRATDFHPLGPRKTYPLGALIQTNSYV